MITSSRDNCPILRATNVMGDQWSILILREFFLEGPRRFQDLQDMLGLSPNTLSNRLKKLENAGIVARRAYSSNPPRSEYVLTEAGRALGPVMGALRQWGETHTPDLT
ncbi:transcriptional regulator, HxlR family [Roseovarius azorensis]|uniref:Transcriptional regulator, HxlR family n=1 Tax=Roseovarius azorensis TaxID=1287727 RepID=A0A1H7UHG0_9RHOB|nr:helix-turn-helix domain-containing protein [Roseovarius azorensis]SEL96195.1 transcriptional regulator, HxlR family [Roseovarius azorensis]